MLSLVFDPNMRARVCVWQDGLSSRSALWDLCYTGAPPLQPCCHDPAERGGLCSYICCNAVTINGLLMPTSACCSSDFKHLLQPSYCALDTLTSWRLHILKVYVFYLNKLKKHKTKTNKQTKNQTKQKAFRKTRHSESLHKDIFCSTLVFQCIACSHLCYFSLY